MSGILVIGSFVMDQVSNVDDFPIVGQTIIGKSLHTYPGGKGANQCITISRLGQSVKMIGKVGNDENGNSFKRLFNNENLPCDGILTCNSQPTGMGLIQLNKHRDNQIVVIPGANHSLTIDEIYQFKNDIIHSDFVLTQLELSLEVEFALITLCAEHNVKVILNPAPAADIPIEILSKVYLLTPNETELAYLTKMPTSTPEEIEKACLHLIDLGVSTVVCTMGSKGAMIANNEKIEIVNAFSVPVVDTVAAGDSFNGALVTCLYSGKSLHDAVVYANATAALCVQSAGAIPSIPTKEKVDQFLLSKS